MHDMSDPLPVVLVPGLNCSARLYAEQVAALWRFGPVTVADHTRDDSMTAIARRILADAPPRFALAGLSMGGYTALELLRQAPNRIAKVALLDTAARADTPEQSARRDKLIGLAQAGKFAEVNDTLWPVLVHKDRQSDTALRAVVDAMAADTGPEAFVRQQTALKARADYRGGLADVRCPALVLVGEGDVLTPPDRSQEIAAGIPGAKLVTIPDCGHLSTLERPQAVNAALTAWMEA
jgi:pimeloyl-ACP methyl ester carboxylesterase